MSVIVAASRMKHPLDARALARLAARYAGDGPGEVIGFGLSNNERNGDTSAWEGAFRIARTAGLRSVPHAGELLGPDAIRAALAALHPDRFGHGVRSVEDPRLVDALAARGVPLEVCPASNVHLGVFPDAASVPLRTLMGAGVQVALAADDPLLFLSRLTDQYAIARDVRLQRRRTGTRSRRRPSTPRSPRMRTSVAGRPRWTPGSPTRRGRQARPNRPLSLCTAG